MAYDPRFEDYQRLGLRFARSLDDQDPAVATQAFANFGRRFAQDRDSLPQTDEDRAFHLVSLATTVVDYELPFADEQRAARLVRRGHELLDEALALDANCFDAIRMQQAASIPSFDGYFDFLVENEGDVRRYCEEAHARAIAKGMDERSLLEADLVMRPYLRWLAAEAEKAVICGRNRQAIEICERSYEFDPQDAADARFTEAIALAKLEDADGLEGLERRQGGMGVPRRHETDAWTQLAHVSLCHSRHDSEGGLFWLGRLIETYPNAASSLVSQRELPDGVFCRLAVPPYSEDELVLAISECTVLLQEGRDTDGRGALGAWVAEHAAELDPEGAGILDGGREDGRGTEGAGHGKGGER